MGGCIALTLASEDFNSALFRLLETGKMLCIYQSLTKRNITTEYLTSSLLHVLIDRALM